MPKVIFSERAIQDMVAIGRYIAQDNPGAAENMMRRFHRKTALLVDFPYMGQEKLELGNGRRHLVIKPYLIIYRILTNGNVRILRILHGARYLPGLL